MYLFTLRRMMVFTTLMVSVPVWAGPVFDDLLNYPIIDQQCPRETIKEEGLGLVVQGKAGMIAVTADQPVGQTFRLSDRATVLWRLCLGLCHWPDDWKEDEALTVTLWDSPARKKKFYQRTVDFARKWSKWDTAFDMHLPTSPEASYYVEITHNGGGDGRIRVVCLERDEYPRGQAWVGGRPRADMDLYFVAICKHQGDREVNLKRFLDRFDFEDPALAEARKAYQAGELDRACDLVLSAFEELLRKPDMAWVPGKDEKFDPTPMDPVVDEGRLYHENGRDFIPMGPETTWREVWPGTSEYVRFNDLFRKLGWAYAVTQDEKYARKLDELMLDYMQDNASPFEGGMRGGRWVAMFIAWRLGDAWNGMASALDSQGLSRDVRLGWIDYWDRMAEFAQREPSGGNHANAVAEALMGFSSKFTLYRRSRETFIHGFDKLVRNSMKLFGADGACVEPAMNYHGFSLANLISGLDRARKYGLDVPPEIDRVVEKALAYTAYMLRPDGTIPTYGDTNCEDFRADTKKWNGWREGEVMDGYRRYGREDLLFIATAGRKGQRPEATAHAFPDIGHYVMRSDWGQADGLNFENARYLFFRAGRFGSHGHEDLNMVTLYAYGRPLLIDPGRTTYGTPFMDELTSCNSHNVLLVEGQRMQKSSPRLHLWRTGTTMDLVDNSYQNLYPGVNHRRAVLFVRPDYFVLFDQVHAEKPVKAGLNFWLVPPDVRINEQERILHTDDPAGANLIIKSLRPENVEFARRQGRLDLHGERNDIPVVTLWQSNIRQSTFATILFPVAQGREPYPVSTSLMDLPARAVSQRAATLCIVGPEPLRDYVFYSPEPASLACEPNVRIAGRAGLIRTQYDKPTNLALVEGTHLEHAGIPLLKSRKPVSFAAVQYGWDAVYADIEPAEPSCALATLGRTKAVINGRNLDVSGEYFQPFAAR